MQDIIERSVTIPADIEAVWDALTTREGIQSWFGDEIEIDLTPGGEASFGWSEYGEKVHAVIQEVITEVEAEESAEAEVVGEEETAESEAPEDGSPESAGAEGEDTAEPDKTA